MTRYADRGTMGLPVGLWPYMHPIQHFVGRGYHRYGGGAVRPNPWWRYPVTFTVYRAWGRYYR